MTEAPLSEGDLPWQEFSPVSPEARFVWALKVLAQPAGFQYDFPMVGLPRDEAASEFEYAMYLLGRCRRMEIGHRQNASLPDHLQRVADLMVEISGIEENWTEDAVATMPEWGRIRSLSRDALPKMGHDSTPPLDCVEPTEFIAVNQRQISGHEPVQRALDVMKTVIFRETDR